MTQRRDFQPIHGFRDDALGDHDGVGIMELIRKKEVKVEEVLEAAMQRCQVVDPQLNAVQLTCFDQARDKAQDGRGLTFGGLPTFVKDNIDVKGLPTNYGSAAFKASPAKSYDPFVDQFLSLGFNPIGKSRLPEFGFNASTEFVDDPPCRNPWNLDYSAGGSSGGAAALVAAGVVPIAHANDGGGSIRIPASHCGLVGLKPSRYRLLKSRSSEVAVVDIISQGVVSRSVRDTAYFLHGAEVFAPSKKFAPVGLVKHPGKRRLKVGILLESVTGHETCSETRKTVELTAQTLEELGHTIVEATSPVGEDFVDDFSTYWGMLSFVVANIGKVRISSDFDKSRLDQFTRGLSADFRKRVYAMPKFLYRLKRSWHAYVKAFKKFDLLLCPVLNHKVPELGYLSPKIGFEELFGRLEKYAGFTPLQNASGGPAIALPMGQSKEGLPIGIQLAALHGQERRLLEVAYELEEARPFRRIQDA